MFTSIQYRLSRTSSHCTRTADRNSSPLTLHFRLRPQNQNLFPTFTPVPVKGILPCSVFFSDVNNIISHPAFEVSLFWLWRSCRRKYIHKNKGLWMQIQYFNNRFQTQTGWGIQKQRVEILSYTPATQRRHKQFAFVFKYSRQCGSVSVSRECTSIGRKSTSRFKDMRIWNVSTILGPERGAPKIRYF